jgi:predicted metal-dependent hydrolase
LKHKEEARRLVAEKLTAWAPISGAAFGKVSIRNQKTVWGSCSKKGDLSFNYKIVFLPPDLQDYLIVHELSHLKEMNHSPRFWALVARCIPNYEAHRRSLRKRGPKYY